MGFSICPVNRTSCLLYLYFFPNNIKKLVLFSFSVKSLLLIIFSLIIFVLFIFVSGNKIYFCILLNNLSVVNSLSFLILYFDEFSHIYFEISCVDIFSVMHA